MVVRMNALVRIEGERAVADSRDVASQFGKQHAHVLRSIDTMVKTCPDLASNFGCEVYAIQTGDGGQRHARRFDMDRKGFMMLVMGFNGAKAIAIKSRWIDAFDAMERALLARDHADNDAGEVPALTGPSTADYLPALAVIREARQVFGRGAAQRLWSKLGLPEVTDHPGNRFEVAANYRVADSIRDWMAQCTRPDPLATSAAADLYGSYVSWCAETGGKPETQTAFGNTLQRMGFVRRKVRDGRVHRAGLDLLN